MFLLDADLGDPAHRLGALGRTRRGRLPGPGRLRGPRRRHQPAPSGSVQRRL